MLINVSNTEQKLVESKVDTVLSQSKVEKKLLINASNTEQKWVESKVGFPCLMK